MKLTHIQVRRIVRKPYFSTKSPSTSASLRQREVRVWPVGIVPCPAPFCLRFKMMDPGFVCFNNPDRKASPIVRTPLNIWDHGWCARWVNRSLTIEHKIDRKADSSELLVRFEAEGGAFFSRIVTAGETWPITLKRRQKEQDKKWYRQGIHALVSRWRKAVQVDGDFVEK
jgi:hypothetical protein